MAYAWVQVRTEDETHRVKQDGPACHVRRSMAPPPCNTHAPHYTEHVKGNLRWSSFRRYLTGRTYRIVLLLLSP